MANAETQTAPTRPPVLLLALLLAAWMLPGLFGRDPWKADEAYTVGLVLNITETGDWVVPTLGADPFMEKPPVFFLVAAGFAKWLAPPLSFHDATRLACIFYVGLSLWILARCARLLHGPTVGWLSAILLLGSVGLVHHAHLLVTDLALVAGCTVALYGMALALTQPWLGGLVCGTGCGIAFLAKGLLGPGTLGLTLLALPVVSRAWRTRAFIPFLVATALASLPWLVIWPTALWLRSPEQFKVWIWDNNFGRFLGRSSVFNGSSGFLPYFKIVAYFAFPVLPLALVAVWRERRRELWQPSFVLPVVNFLVLFAVLNASKQARDNYALPMLPPLAMLAARAVVQLSPGWVKGLNRFTFILLSTLAAGLWLGWIAQFTGTPGFVLQAIRKPVPDFVPQFGWIAFLIAAAASWGWLKLMTRRVSDETWVPVHWTAGVALLYLLGMTLWLPVTNANMSYRHTFDGLRATLPPDYGVLMSKGLGEPQRAMLHYFAGLKTWMVETRGQTNAHWLLVEGRDREGERPQAPSADWQMVWQGFHHREMFNLYHRP